MQFLELLYFNTLNKEGERSLLLYFLPQDEVIRLEMLKDLINLTNFEKLSLVAVKYPAMF